MPVYDNREPQIPILPFLIVSNIFPLIGVLYYHMSFFMLFYVYWCETCIISIFNLIKMGKASRQDVPDPGLTINGKNLTSQQVNSKKYMRRMYGSTRCFILLFYLLFIVVFVGLMESVRHEDSTTLINMADILFFRVRWMQITLGVFILLHAIQYWQWLATREYEETSLRQLGSPFDGRMIVMHIVIVLGTFLSIYASEHLFPNNPHAGQIAFASLFVFLKIMLDIISYNRNNKRSHTLLNVYDAITVKKPVSDNRR